MIGFYVRCRCQRRHIRGRGLGRNWRTGSYYVPEKTSNTRLQRCGSFADIDGKGRTEGQTDPREPDRQAVTQTDRRR